MLFPVLAAASLATVVSSGTVEVTKALIVAAEYGRVLGAAAQCDNIDRQRLGAATHKASLAVRGMVRTPDEFENARGSFESGASDGGANVSEGRESCSDAARALRTLEVQMGG